MLVSYTVIHCSIEVVDVRIASFQIGAEVGQLVLRGPQRGDWSCFAGSPCQVDVGFEETAELSIQPLSTLSCTSQVSEIQVRGMLSLFVGE